MCIGVYMCVLVSFCFVLFEKHEKHIITYTTKYMYYNLVHHISYNYRYRRTRWIIVPACILPSYLLMNVDEQKRVIESNF